MGRAQDWFLTVRFYEGSVLGSLRRIHPERPSRTHLSLTHPLLTHHSLCPSDLRSMGRFRDPSLSIRLSLGFGLEPIGEQDLRAGSGYFAVLRLLSQDCVQILIMEIVTTAGFDLHRGLWAALLSLSPTWFYMSVG